MPPPSILLQPVTLTCTILVNPYQHPLPDNHTSIQPNSVAVRVLYALLPLSVLGVCEVGGNTKTSATTHISSELLVVSARPLILEVTVSPVYDVYLSTSASAASVLILCLPTVWI